MNYSAVHKINTHISNFFTDKNNAQSHGEISTEIKRKYIFQIINEKGFFLNK